MDENIIIPVLVKYDIEEISFSGVKNHKAGEVFQFNPEVFMHIELEDSGFFEQIDNSECKFICNTPVMNFNNKVYEYNDILETDGVADSTLFDLAVIGNIRKELLKTSKYYQKPTVIKIPKVVIKKDKPDVKIKPDNRVTYLSIAKELDMPFADFKKLTQEKTGKKIAHHSNKITKAQKKKILEAIK